MPAKLAAVINMKGGVGKTTLSFNLAMYLAETLKQRVLLVDLDPQANATVVSTAPAAYAVHCRAKKTVADIFIHAFRTYGPIRPLAPKPLAITDFIFSVYDGSGAGKFDLVPSELMLSSILRGMTLGPFDLDHLITTSVLHSYDYILVDCAPTYSSLTTVALNTTRAVLIPMIADSFGAHGTALMKQVLTEHEHDFGFAPRVIGVVFTLWEKQANQVAQSTEIVKNWTAANVFTAKISRNNWYRIANGKRVSIMDSPAHAETKKEFEDFVTEFQAKA